MNPSPSTPQRRVRWAWLSALFATLLALALWKGTTREERVPAAEQGGEPPELEVKAAARPELAARDRHASAQSQGAAGVGGAVVQRVAVTPIPPVGTHGKSKTWVRAKYGKGQDELGFTEILPDGEGEARAPQGFTITPDGELLVLDSEKERLLWFGPDARIERRLPVEGLVMPADVAVAADGTIVVMDHEGVQTKGTLLLSPDGKLKGTLPQSARGTLRELYVVGNDIFGKGLGSIKLGDTSGVPSDETPGLYRQGGKIPGSVAPDGRTVLTAGIESDTEGRFFLSVLRDDPPKHIYTRQYSVPTKDLAAIPYIQADAAGTIYVVLFYDDDQTTLVCFDGETGDPMGSVAMPMDDKMAGAAFKQFAINREQGGLVYHHMLENSSSYEIYDCR